jgi:hypothetical protein
MLELSPNPILSPRKADRPPDVNDRRLVTHERKRALRDARQARTAAEAIGRPPAEGEAVHLVIDGRYSLWDLVPALQELTRANFRTLHLSTLGVNRRTVSQLCEMFDAGVIGKAWLLCSHYFSKADAADFTFAQTEFKKRPGMRVHASRTHAKICLIHTADGHRFTIESSANLRSCKAIEQATIFAGRALHDFHRRWIEGVFAAEASP